MFLLFGSKSGKYLKVSRMYRFEAKRNPKTPQNVKLDALQNGCLSYFFDFCNQNEKKEKCLQNPKFLIYPKKEYILQNNNETTHIPNFNAISFFFTVQWQKTGKGDDVTSLK